MMRFHKNLKWFIPALCFIILSLYVLPATFADTNLALSKPITANNNNGSSHVATYANDNKLTTWWEGAPNQYPNIITVDLGSAQWIGTVLIKINLSTGWPTRTQTLSVLGSTDNITFNTIVDSATYTFETANYKTATITFASTYQRYVRLNFSANSLATGGQVCELVVYAGPTPSPATPTPTPTVTPGAPTPTKTPTTTPTATPTPAPVRGASVPWVEYEAENGTTNGTVLGPNRLVGDLAGEASGRRAVKLSATGQYVQWTTTVAANSIVIRNCIPDVAGGGGTTATISLYVNGTHRQDITLKSKYAWLYGDESNPTNNPSSGAPRRIYDESHALTGDIPAGATVKLQKDAGDTAAYYGIDFIDLEQVPAPLTMPANFLSVTAYGATPDDTTDDAQAISNCISAARTAGKGVWIPPGVYYQQSKILAYNITIRGAGMWYTTLYCPSEAASDWGYLGFILRDGNVKIYDMALFGESTIRGIGGKPFCSSAGAGSEFGNIWIEHTNCGYWAGAVDVTDGVHVYGWRVRNVFADGINLCNSTKNSIIEQCTVRNSGDDAFAIWSATDLSSAPCQNNTIRYCTVQNVWRANAYAIYGGANNKIENCLAYDTLTYGGVNISSCFAPAPFSGTTTVNNIGLYRCGGNFWGGLPFGALWLNCDDSDMSGIVLSNIDIYDSTYSGLMLQSETYQHPTPHVISNTSFNNINIIGTGATGIYVRAGSRGSASFTNVVVSGAAEGGLQNDAATTFTVNKISGNAGW